jgi:hypothetical protein
MPSSELAALRREPPPLQAEHAPRAADVPLSLEEALASAGPGGDAAAEALWLVDRADFGGASFSMLELQDLVKRGWLHRGDGIRPVGDQRWTQASEHPELVKPFAVRAKLDAQNLSQATARGAALPCANHADKRARWRCGACQRVFCAECGNETEVRQQMVTLCIDCDEPMTPLSPRPG